MAYSTPAIAQKAQEKALAAAKRLIIQGFAPKIEISEGGAYQVKSADSVNLTLTIWEPEDGRLQTTWTIPRVET